MIKKLLVSGLFMLLLSPLSTFAVPTKAEAKLAMQCYNNTFYYQYGTYGTSYKAYYYSDTYKNGRMDCWKQAEAIETLIDAYNTNNDADFKNKIQYLYNGMRDNYGTLWTSNIYNDDVIWGALMCIRAFNIWNDGGMKTMAKENFDMVWARAWDTTLGGGLWWTTAKTSKNACVNAPAAICAMYLYYATGDVTYKTKAKQIIDWMISKLYNTSTGALAGAINSSGVITEGTRTYTQGTFIGACGEVYKYYTTPNYKNYGITAMNYTKNTMCNAAGLMPDEYDNADTQGFKTILARWACQFVKDYSLQASYGSWLNYNATQAWANRNSSGLMWGLWGSRTSDAYLNAFETTTGLSMMNDIWLYNATTTLLKTPTDLQSEELQTTNVSIYPNPASDFIILSNVPSRSTYSMYDISGKKVLSGSYNENDKIDVSSIKSGIYLLKILKYNAGTFTQKIAIR